MRTQTVCAVQNRPAVLHFQDGISNDRVHEGVRRIVLDQDKLVALCDALFYSTKSRGCARACCIPRLPKILLMLIAAHLKDLDQLQTTLRHAVGGQSWNLVYWI